MRATGLGLMLAAGLLAAHAASAAVRAGAPADVRVTVYRDSPGLVSEARAARIPPGPVRLLLDGLPAHLKADSLRLFAPGMTVLSERISDRPLSAEVLRQRALGGKVTLYPKAQTEPKGGLSATLVAVDGGAPVVRVHGRLEVIDAASPWRIAYPASLAPAKPGTRVTARVKGPAGGPVALTYLTDGLSWHADYVATLNGQGTRVALQAFASVSNRCGRDFDGVRVSVVAGHLHRGAKPRARMVGMAAAAAPGQRAQVEPLFAYYVFRLPGRIALRNGSTTRLPLMAQQSLSVKREYRIEGQAAQPASGAQGGAARRHAQVLLHLKNSAGAPLPAGVWRLYGERAQMPALLGEDRASDIPRGAAFTLNAGRAVDITARHTELSRRRIDAKTYSARWQVRVHNAKASAVRVRVVEPLPGTWTIEQESAPHERVDAAHAAWLLKVPAGGETTLSYRVRWQ